MHGVAPQMCGRVASPLLEEQRRATLLVNVGVTPRELNEWGALVGRLAGDYWQVPALVGIERVPAADEMKHFGAALASYGSVALFHVVGMLAPSHMAHRHGVGESDIRAFQRSYLEAVDTVDLVVFSAPQPSLFEIGQIAGMLEGRRASIPLFVVTSPQVKGDADRMGLTARIEAAGGSVLSGMCFYQSYRRWRRRTAGGGWRPIRPSSSTSSAATVISRC